MHMTRGPSGLRNCARTKSRASLFIEPSYLKLRIPYREKTASTRLSIEVPETDHSRNPFFKLQTTERGGLTLREDDCLVSGGIPLLE